MSWWEWLFLACLAAYVVAGCAYAMKDFSKRTEIEQHPDSVGLDAFIFGIIVIIWLPLAARDHFYKNKLRRVSA